MKIVKLEKIGSTNDYAKELIKSGCAGRMAVIAAEQSAGRGSGDRSFYSPPGGVYLSYVMVPETSPEDTAGITVCAGVAARRALCALYPGLDIRIKPVNDLYLNGHKIGGILTELSRGALVIGVGINVNTLFFPKELNASSLLLETGTETDPAAVARALLDELMLLDASWPDCRTSYEEEYSRYRIPEPESPAPNS